MRSAARQCGAEACRVVGLALPRAALGGLSAFVFADRASDLPPDLAPVTLDLFLDPSGFPVRMETRIAAGPTVTDVVLQLARLDASAGHRAADPLTPVRV